MPQAKLASFSLQPALLPQCLCPRAISCQRASKRVERTLERPIAQGPKMKIACDDPVGLPRLLLLLLLSPSGISISSLINFSPHELFHYCFTFLCPLLSTGYPRLISRGLVATFGMHDTWGHRAVFRPPQPKAPVAPPDGYMCKLNGGYILI